MLRTPSKALGVENAEKGLGIAEITLAFILDLGVLDSPGS